MASRDHLVSEQRTDKNGVTRTRWVKPDVAVKKAGTMPAPQTKPQAPVVTNADRRDTILRSIQTMGKERASSKIDDFLSGATPEQIAVVDDALMELTDDNSDAAVKRKKYVAARIIRICIDDATVIAGHDMFRYREAFSSHWAQNNHPSMTNAERIMLGLRGFNLPFDDEAVNPNDVACVRFAYEMKARFPDAPFLPVSKNIFQLRINGVRGFNEVDVYKEPKLPNLIWENPDRVDDLIAFAAARETSDAQRLEEMLSLDGSKVLAEGLL
jgi:hypothetical protein